jgi:hypothetical protein
MRILYSFIFLIFSWQASAIAPTTASQNLQFNAIDGGFFNIGWTSGNGARRIIICKAGSNVTFSPQNGIDYDANTNFGDGQMVAPGEYVIYDHFSSSFFVTGLTPGTRYFFKIFEYNGSGSTTEYLTSTFLSGDGTTSAIPASQASNATFPTITTNSVNVSWNVGSGGRRLIVVREGSPVASDPENSHPYAVSSIFESGATTGPGDYTVYNSSGTNTTVTNLKPGTQYFFSFYEFNGSQQPQYKTPAYTTSVTTRSIPTIASSALSITKTDGKELSLGWTNGNGQRRIIVAKQGSNVTGQPANGTDYTPGAFGTGSTIATGEFVVFDDNFSSTTVTGLTSGVTYFFKIFEYDGTGTNTIYLTSTFASVNGPTAIAPATQMNSLSASSITGNSLKLSGTPGDGRARMIVGRKNAPVNFTPTNFTTYTHNSDFGSSPDLGNGNFVLSNTTDPFVNIHNLEPLTTYHFAVFEYNGFNQPVYLSPAATFSATTLAALPVKLIKWEAIPSNNKVSLQWTTSAEINASHFIIERSSNGVNFSPIATIQATGNSQSNINYTKEDNSPLTGRSYYRLKMVDIDGQSEYSAVRSVLFSASQSALLARNPVRDIVEIVTSASASNNKNEWQIVNINGQVLKKGTLSSGRTEVNVSTLTTGNYWIRLNINSQLQTLPFIKL